MKKTITVLFLCVSTILTPTLTLAQTAKKQAPTQRRHESAIGQAESRILQKCTPAYKAKWVNAHPDEATKPPKPKPSPAPITACSVSPERINSWKEELLRRKTERIKTLPLYSRENAGKLAEVMKIVRPIEKKYDLEPGFLVYLAWLESGFDKNAHPPDDLSSAFSWYQWLIPSGKDAGLLDGTKEAEAQGWVCADTTAPKGRCKKYVQSTCLKTVPINDRRNNLALSSEATAKNLKTVHDKWGPTFGWWWHHNPSSRGSINEPLIQQLKLGRSTTISEPKSVLAFYGIRDAIDVAGAAVLCGGRAGQVGKNLTDGSLTYPASVKSGADVLKLYQPALVGEIEKDRALWYKRKSTK